MPPIVSAIVLNYRTPLDCVTCVQALLKQTIADRMEIMIVDNHSDDESVGLLRARFSASPQVRMLESAANAGFGRGNMVAARQARGKYLLFINPDNTLPPDAVENMVAISEADASVGIIGPALVHPDGSIRPSARKLPAIRDIFHKRMAGKAWLREHERFLGSGGNILRDVEWVVGACLYVRRDVFERIHGFDPRFFLFFEDTDLCRRCLEAGKRVVYAPGIRVSDRKERLSEGGFTSLLTKRMTRIHLKSAFQYFWKWRGRGLTKART